MENTELVYYNQFKELCQKIEESLITNNKSNNYFSDEGHIKEKVINILDEMIGIYEEEDV